MYAEARGRILAAGCGSLSMARHCLHITRGHAVLRGLPAGGESSELWKGDPVRTGSRTARLRRRGKRLSSRYPSSPHHAISLAETRSSLALTHSWGCCVCRRSKKGVSFAPTDSTIADLGNVEMVFGLTLYKRGRLQKAQLQPGTEPGEILVVERRGGSCRPCFGRAAHRPRRRGGLLRLLLTAASYNVHTKLKSRRRADEEKNRRRGALSGPALTQWLDDR